MERREGTGLQQDAQGWVASPEGGLVLTNNSEHLRGLVG